MAAQSASELRLLFSHEEYGARLEAVRRAMRERGVDVLLLDEAESLFYATGWESSANMYQVCVVPLDHDPVMVVRRLDEPAFVEHTWIREHVSFADWEEPVDLLARTLTQRGWVTARIGIDLGSHFMPVRRYEAIKAVLPKATFIDFSGVLWELRLRKSPQEIAFLRKAARVADVAMTEAIAAVGEGKSERDAAAAASQAFFRLGADPGRVGPITSGERSGILHGTLGDRRLAPGEIIHMELVPQVHGYTARLMRPTVIQEPSPVQRKTAALLIQIQDEQFAAMKPGAVAKDIDRICREQVLKAGLRETYDNITGYTLGHYPAARCRGSDFTRTFLPNSEWSLEPGMVFHMYTSAGGMSFSETMLVTEAGAERLTQMDRKLFIR